MGFIKNGLKIMVVFTAFLSLSLNAMAMGFDDDDFEEAVEEISCYVDFSESKFAHSMDVMKRWLAVKGNQEQAWNTFVQAKRDMVTFYLSEVSKECQEEISHDMENDSQRKKELLEEIDDDIKFSKAERSLNEEYNQAYMELVQSLDEKQAKQIADIF